MTILFKIGVGTKITKIQRLVDLHRIKIGADIILTLFSSWDTAFRKFLRFMVG